MRAIKMKVKELIKELDMFDKELDVCVLHEGKFKDIEKVDIGKNAPKFYVVLDIGSIREEEDNEPTHIDKIKLLKKTIRVSQTYHPDSDKIYVTIEDLAKELESVIKRDELELYLDALKKCGDVIELPKGCWRII
jgi:hypothetical protein